MSPDLSTAHITSSSSVNPTINAWRIYLEDQGNSPHTVKAFTHDLELLANYLPPEATLGNIATTDINNFLNWMQSGRGVPCSPKTLARRITAIKSFFRWLNKNGVVLIDPAEKVVQKSVLSPLPEVLTEKEIEKALQITEEYRYAKKPDARYSTLFSLLLHTGIKKSECLGLSINHIDLDNKDEPVIFIRYASPQHRYKERKIYVPSSWLIVFNDYKEQYEITDQVFPWSQRRLEYLLEDISEKAAINKHISFDMCRWTCALRDWKIGMEKEKIRQKLGVSKVQWREISMKLGKLSSASMRDRPDQEEESGS
jgi:site-specific recombinase XerD